MVPATIGAARQSGARRASAPGEAGLGDAGTIAGAIARLSLARPGRATVGLRAAAFLCLAVIAGPSGFAAAAPSGGSVPDAEVTLSMAPVGAISPLMYGVNYVWHFVPSDQIREFDAAMRRVAHYTLARYPGGWAAERYDWAANREVGGRVERPGVDPDTFLAIAPRASFVVRSSAAIQDPAQVPVLAREAADLVRRYGDRVAIWEIGNEWWLQRGGRRYPEIRRENLAAYAALLASVAPAMKAVSPRIEIYATGDWTAPEEFGAIRSLAGPAAWSTIDGISVHGYCGDLDSERLCREIPERATAIRSITGKQKLYDSEWSIGRRVSSDDYGIRNANQMVSAVQDLAFAHVTAAAYWPPVRGVPAIAFVSDDFRQPYATGLIFGWMSRYYRGQALRTSGDLPAAAARSADGVTLFIASMDNRHRMVHIPLAGTGLNRVASAEVMFAEDPDDPDRSRIVQFAPLPTRIGRDAGRRSAVEFEVDPGTPGRGSSWEIARVTLQ